MMALQRLKTTSSKLLELCSTGQWIQGWTEIS